MGFQTKVNVGLPLAYAGDFANANPRRQLTPPPAQAGGITTSGAAATDAFVASTGGVIIGNFAWITAAGANTLTSAQVGSAAPDGFVARTQMGLILTQPTGFTASTDTWYGNTIPVGQNVVAFKTGSFFVQCPAGSGATAGQKCFAKLTDGSVAFGAAGATIAGYIETTFTADNTALASEMVIISA
jgi:hypothetical protein